MSDIEAKEKIAWDWVDEVITLYKNKLINWDVFNEIVHGDDFVKMFGRGKKRVRFAQKFFSVFVVFLERTKNDRTTRFKK